MKIGFFTVTEWITLLTFVSGIIFGFAKLYALLQSILKRLDDLVVNFSESKNDRAILHKELEDLRLDISEYRTKSEEKFKTIFNKLQMLERRERGNDK